MNLDSAIVFVRDMSAATAFFRDVLELPLRFESEHWTEFQSGPATLALHLADDHAAPPAEAHRSAGSVRIGFGVRDLDTFHDRMLEHGVDCLQPPRDVYGGVRVATYRGIDGVEFGASDTRHKNS